MRNVTKTKKIMVRCSLCKRTLSLEIPVSIKEEKKYFPFEYLFVHGQPEHAIMLFLDANLSVRDEIVYKDLLTAKKQAKEFSNFIHMTEYETLASIYNDPVRPEILRILSEGPIKSNDLIETLENHPEFDTNNFQLVILPLIKTNLVKSRWLHETFFECYFLVKDLLIIKVAHKQTMEKIANNPQFSLIKDSYLNNVNKILQDFKDKVLAGQDQLQAEIQRGLQILISKEYKKVHSLIGDGPLSLREVKNALDKDSLEVSFNNEIFYNFNINGEEYCSLAYDYKIQYFLPSYLMNKIAHSLREKKISLEMANTHLDLLFESEKELKIIRK